MEYSLVMYVKAYFSAVDYTLVYINSSKNRIPSARSGSNIAFGSPTNSCGSVHCAVFSFLGGWVGLVELSDILVPHL